MGEVGDFGQAAEPNTNVSQSFIGLGDLELPHQSTVFGGVSEGMEAMDAVAASPTDSQGRPRTEAVISKVSVTAG